MRLLWLTPEVPEPGGTGGAIRAFHILRGVVRRGLQPVVVAPAYPEQADRARATAAEGVELRLVPRPARQAQEALVAHVRHPRLAASLVRRPFLGWQADVFWTELEATVRRALAEGPDAAVIEHDFCLPWAMRLPEGLPVAFAGHNATWVQLARDAASAAGPRAVLLDIEARRYRRQVRETLPRCSWWSAVSDGDAAAMRALGAGPVCVAPNGTDTAAVRELPAGGGEPGRLLFCGTLSYPPNADAVRWFARDILPLVRRSVPDARLRVVGRGAPAELERLDGVELAGWVDDLRPEFAAAPVALAPLRSGGGSRLKVVEALGAGRALVATAIGAEGLEVTDGEHLRIADDPVTFATAVTELLQDPDERVRLGAAGRRRAAERYDWAAIADDFATSLGAWAGAA